MYGGSFRGLRFLRLGGGAGKREGALECLILLGFSTNETLWP